MSMEEAKKLYETIAEDEELQKELKKLESEEELFKGMLEIARQKGFEVTQSEIKDYIQQLSEKASEMDEEELEKVAGGEDCIDHDTIGPYIKSVIKGAVPWAQCNLPE